MKAKLDSDGDYTVDGVFIPLKADVKRMVLKEKPKEKHGGFSRLIGGILAIILLDRWIFEPIRRFTTRKGPFIVVRPVRAPKKRSKRQTAKAKESAMRKKWTLWTLAILALVVAGGFATYHWAKAKYDASKQPPVTPPAA